MKPGQYLMVTADQNDADYIIRNEEISSEDLAKLIPVIEAIKAFKPYKGHVDNMHWTHGSNWPRGENAPRRDLGEKSPKEIYPHINPDLIEWFSEEFVPYGKYGIHSIESIELVQISSAKKLL